MSLPNHYAALKLDSDASFSEIVESYKRLRAVYHPDRNKSPTAPRDFACVVEAYRCLRDSGARATYDAEFGEFKCAPSYRPAPSATDTVEDHADLDDTDWLNSFRYVDSPDAVVSPLPDGATVERRDVRVGEWKPNWSKIVATAMVTVTLLLGLVVGILARLRGSDRSDGEILSGCLQLMLLVAGPMLVIFMMGTMIADAWKRYQDRFS